MIERIRIKNFRSMADVDVTLGQLTVLVGRNGAGKSAFIDAFRFVRDVLSVGLENSVINRHGIGTMRRWSPTRPYDVEITVNVKAPRFWGEYSFCLSSGKEGLYKVKRESCQAGRIRGQILDEFECVSGKLVKLQLESEPARTRFETLFDMQGEQLADATSLALGTAAFFSGLVSQFRRVLRGSFYNIFPNTLREPQKPSAENLLADNGENFASVLQKLCRDKEWFPDLKKALAQVVHGIRNVRVGQVGGYLITELEHKDLRDLSTTADSLPWFDLSQESDGTVRMLGMLVALYQKNPQHTLLALEEPEIALHPGAVAVLSDVIREVATRRQLLITTQSPDLISRFNVDELRVVERVNGVTQIGVVDSVQRETINEQLFSAGDLLRIEGLHRDLATAG